MSADGWFIARIAGLPADAVLELRDTDLTRQVLALDQRPADHQRVKTLLSDQLYEVIGDAEPELRRHLLSVRRDSHNSRSLERHAKREYWATVVALCPAAIEALRRERQCRKAEDELTEAYERSRERAVACLWQCPSSDPGFRRGLALASPDLTRTYFKYRDRPNALKGRKRRRFEESLTRYVSRAAVKLSPYSTLTRVAFGRLRHGAPPGLRWTSEKWCEVSSVQARRYLLEQLVAVWSAIPGVRERLALTGNRSVAAYGPKLRFLRPPSWQPDDSGHSLKLRSSGISQLPDDPLWHRLLEAAEESATWSQAVGHLENQLAIDRGSAEGLLQRGRSVGLIEVLPPWNRDQPHLEAALLKAMESHGGPDPARESLAAAIELQKGFRDMEDSRVDSVAARVESHLLEAFKALGSASELKVETPWILRRQEVYEDVLLQPRDGPQDQGLGLSSTLATDLLETLSPWVELAQCLSPRWDFLLTLGHSLRPSGDDFLLMDVFIGGQKLWRQYREHLRDAGRPKGFNPFDLKEIHQLHGLQDDLRRGTHRLFNTTANVSIDRSELLQLTDRIPMLLRQRIGACAFVQAADQTGERWVLNEMFEGTGRYSGRFAQLLRGDTRRQFLDACRAARPETPGEWMELAWARGDNLMAHPPLRDTLLESPGDTGHGSANEEPRRTLGPRDLRLKVPKDPAEPPYLTDPEGARLYSLHLGGAAALFLPSWLQFVATFGPQETSFPSPPIQWQEVRPGVSFAPRITLDNLVLRRARWKLSAELQELSSTTEPLIFFRTLHQLLRDIDAPDRLYLIEKVSTPDGFSRWKPQFLDLSCPLFVDILQRALAQDDAVIEEALPVPEDFPRAFDGRRRGLELQLDQVAIVIAEDTEGSNPLED